MTAWDLPLDCEENLKISTAVSASKNGANTTYMKCLLGKSNQTVIVNVAFQLYGINHIF